MKAYELLVRTNIHFNDCLVALTHIGATLMAANIVTETYPLALLARENSFPTGIALENHAVAIPHCEVEHALKPAIYLIRPDKPVAFRQADDDGCVDAVLIIALVVTKPAQQLTLLRTLFGQLQDGAFLNQLLTSPSADLETLFSQKIFNQ